MTKSQITNIKEPAMIMAEGKKAAKSEFTPLTLTLANIAVRAANRADPKANILQSVRNVI